MSDRQARVLRLCCNNSKYDTKPVKILIKNTLLTLKHLYTLRVIVNKGGLQGYAYNTPIIQLAGIGVILFSGVGQEVMRCHAGILLKLTENIIMLMQHGMKAYRTVGLDINISWLQIK